MQAQPAQPMPAADSPSRPCIIAIGGAKGGIGKSVLTANLSVWLASRGFSTIAVDMDLGASNLHLYLGVWGLKYRINDFLDKKIDHLEQIAVETTPSGPRLIGGGSSHLGSANLPFARKLKLMRAIRALDADYVIIDLGGDTAYNILDFYLLADHGFVLSTCDPASYLDAYTFVKMSLYRRLTRLFGPESDWRKFKDNDLTMLINSLIGAKAVRNGERACKIEELLEAVSRQMPEQQERVRKAVDYFKPKLILNMADDPLEADDLVARFRKVARNMLSIHVPYVGNIPTDRQIARSTHDLKPEVAVHPHGYLARFLEQTVCSL